MVYFTKEIELKIATMGRRGDVWRAIVREETNDPRHRGGGAQPCGVLNRHKPTTQSLCHQRTRGYQHTDATLPRTAVPSAHTQCAH